MSHSYLTSLITVLQLVKSGIGEQANLLSVEPVNHEEWKGYRVIQQKVQKGKATFINMIPMEDFLEKEIYYCRLKGQDFINLKGKVRNLLTSLGIYHRTMFC